jgi:putative transposase
MMARMARLVLPGMAFHVVQRGKSPRHGVCHGSRSAGFLKILQEYSERYQLRILGYCLMSNHYHVICLPDRENSMALTFGCANAEYSRWIHIQRRQVGQLGQGRYPSCLLDESHLWNSLCSVEQNPVRAGMTVALGVALVDCGRTHRARALGYPTRLVFVERAARSRDLAEGA